VSGAARHSGDKRRPIAVVERRSGDVDSRRPVLLTISRKIAAVIDLDRRGRRADMFERRNKRG